MAIARRFPANHPEVMDRAALPRLAAARADSQRLRKRALLARIETLRIFAELDNTLLHVGMRRYLAEVAPAVRPVDAPRR